MDKWVLGVPPGTLLWIFKCLGSCQVLMAVRVMVIPLGVLAHPPVRPAFLPSLYVLNAMLQCQVFQ